MSSDLPPDPEREALRLGKLAALRILDTPAEPEFDAIVDLAHRLLDCPIAVISLVDDHRQWFKARYGVDAIETPRDQSFCAHNIDQYDVMVIEDATQDPRFADNPLVTSTPHIRFYAGAPLRPHLAEFSDDLPAIGALCVVDTKPHRFSDDDRATLKSLAFLADRLIRARVSEAETDRARQRLEDNAALVGRKMRQLRQAERMASIGSWRLDIATGEVEWSDEVFTIYGLPVDGSPPVEYALSFYPEPDRSRMAHMLDRAASYGEPYDFECDLVSAVGETRRVRVMGEVELVGGQVAAVIGVIQDITERHTYEAKLRLAANTDSLTNLPNRRMFEERLLEVQQHASQTGEPFALLIIDLDGFKPVNDQLGHEVGDTVLREMASRLRGEHFSQAFVARLGGDEFVMLVTRPRDCAELPAFVQSVVRELRYLAERDGVRLAVTATVGAALSDDQASSGADILRQADLALYSAKRAQRGTGAIFGTNEVLHPWGVRRAP